MGDPRRNKRQSDECKEGDCDLLHARDRKLDWVSADTDFGPFLPPLTVSFDGRHSKSDAEACHAENLRLFGAAVLALALTAPSVAANSPPLEVTIEDTVEYDDGNNALGEFVATGPAVDAEVMCPTGASAVISSTRTDIGRGLALLRIHKTATCDDGWGTFNIKMRVFLNPAPGRPRPGGSSRAVRVNTPG